MAVLNRKAKLLVNSFVFFLLMLIINYFLYNQSIFNVNSLDNKTGSINSSANVSKPNTSQPDSGDPPTDDTSQPSVISHPDTPPAAINKNDWNLILVNANNPMPDGFQTNLETLSSGKQVDKRIIPDLNRMMDDAKALGFPLVICSAYRTVDYQTGLFNKEVTKQKNNGLSNDDAIATAKTIVAAPNTSEHHTGLAIDVVALSYQNLNEELLKTPEIKWLYENCYKYGFIVRYPEDKTNMTGIIHEPWHYRYVGVEVATQITEQKITLEEYLEQAS